MYDFDDDVEIVDITIDGERLRRDLMDYYGTAMMGGLPMAVIDVGDVETASNEELLRLAERAGIDLNKYIVR
jgi:hypothetical protein